MIRKLAVLSASLCAGLAAGLFLLLAYVGFNPLHAQALYFELLHPQIDVLKIERTCLDYPTKNCQHSVLSFYFSSEDEVEFSAFFALLEKIKKDSDKIFLVSWLAPLSETPGLPMLRYIEVELSSSGSLERYKPYPYVMPSTGMWIGKFK